MSHVSPGPSRPPVVRPHRARRPAPLLVALVLAAAALLAGCGSAPVVGSAAASPAGQEATALARGTAVAARTATAGTAHTATAAAEVERATAEAASIAERRATMSAQTFLARTTAAERSQRQTAAAIPTIPPPTATAQATPEATPTAARAAAAPAPRPQAPERRLRFVKLNENDDPTCISVAVRGIATGGWSFRVDGLRLSGRFDQAGNARVCGLAPRQEVTISIYDSSGARVLGGQGVQSRGSAIMQGRW